MDMTLFKGNDAIPGSAYLHEYDLRGQSLAPWVGCC